MPVETSNQIKEYVWYGLYIDLYNLGRDRDVAVIKKGNS